MELEGSLKVFSLPEILQFLAMGKMSGSLSVKRENYGITLIFRDGRIINSSTINRPKKLGEMLVSRGFMKRSDLEEVLRLQKTIDTDKMLGQILIERELVTDMILRDAIRLQLEEEIWELFSWDDGYFKFEHGEEKVTYDVRVEIFIEPLLLEGTRRQDEWNKIKKNLPDDTIIVGIKRMEGEFENETTLSDNEWKILSFINSFFSISTIVDRGGLGRFDTYRILNSFLAAGLVEIIDPETLSDKPKFDPDTEPVPEFDEKALTEEYGPKEKTMRLISGLFTKKGAPAQKQLGKLKFLSPVGAISYGLNELMQTFIGQKDFIVSDMDKKMLEHFWRSIVMICPKADLIRVYKNLVDVRQFERFVEMLGMCEALRPVYEDCVHGLRRLTAALYREGIQRLNEKTSHRLAISFIEQTAPRIEITYAQNFNFMDFFMEVLSK